VTIAEQLEKLECQVEPKFSAEMPEDVCLSPIGWWRLAFMRETHLWSNWIRGRFIEETTCLNPFEGLALLDPFNYLMYKSQELVIMNVKDGTPRCVAQLKVVSKYPHVVSVVSSNTVITVDSRNVVQVIDVDLEKHTLSMRHSFCIDQSISIKRAGEWLEYVVKDNIFMGFEGNQIFIWDLVKGKKLKTERIIFQDPNRTVSKYCSDVVLRGYANGYYNYMIYDTKELTFLGFALRYATMQNDCYILKDYIGVTNDSTLKIYNYKTGELVSETAIQMMYGLFSPIFSVKDSFIYWKDNTLCQLTPSNKTTRVLLNSAIQPFKPIVDKCLLVYNSSTRHEIWRVGPVTCVKTPLNFRYPIEVNEIFSLVLVRTPRITVCRFW
jgi:hypothetical protein